MKSENLKKLAFQKHLASFKGKPCPVFHNATLIGYYHASIILYDISVSLIQEIYFTVIFKSGI